MTPGGDPNIDELQPQQINQGFVWKDEGATPIGPEYIVRVEMEDIEDSKDHNEMKPNEVETVV